MEMEMDCRRQPGCTLNKRKGKIKTKKFRAMLQQLLSPFFLLVAG
jgi:hypothetical protein